MNENTKYKKTGEYMDRRYPAFSRFERVGFCVLALSFSTPAWAQEITTASWYSFASCRSEGSSGICASGERMDDELFRCASWDYPFGTVLLVTNVENGKTVRVICNDRGPSKKLYRMGRRLDLTPIAFSALAPLRQGVIKVRIRKEGDDHDQT